MKKSVMILACLLAVAVQAEAGREPCSGSKGGVDHCANGKFICRDGSTSESSKACKAPSELKKAEEKVSHTLTESKDEVKSLEHRLENKFSSHEEHEKTLKAQKAQQMSAGKEHATKPLTAVQQPVEQKAATGKDTSH
ncbi:MAG: hypothetical protein ACRC5A_14415 [Enterobacteriaceae bacterium]